LFIFPKTIIFFVHLFFCFKYFNLKFNFSTSGIKKLIGNIAYLVGLNFVEPLSWNRRFGAFLCFIVLAVSTNIYTLSLFWSDKKKLIEISLILLFGVQGILRLPFHYVDRQTMQVIGELTLKIYTNSESSNAQRKSMENCLKLTWKVLKLIAVFYVIFFILPTLICLFNFLVYGSLAAPFPLVYPFADPNTRQGFIISYPFHFVLGFIGGTCFLSFESSDVFIAMQTQAFVDAFKHNLDELEVEISKPLRDSRKNIGENISKLMKAVIESHRDLRDYHELLQKRLLKVAFSIITLNSYTVCACGIAVLVNKYYTAIGLACAAFSQLFFICAIGTFICHQHERLQKMLWNIEWYKLPKSEQKNFLLLMVHAQMPLNLEPLFVGVIDMELFLSVNLKIFCC
jgi:hypothetical protein